MRNPTKPKTVFLAWTDDQLLSIHRNEINAKRALVKYVNEVYNVTFTIRSYAKAIECASSDKLMVTSEILED